MLKHFPGGTPGFDKDGSPIAIELFGHYDFKGLMLSTKRSDLEKLKLYQCEAVADILKVQSEKVVSLGFPLVWVTWKVRECQGNLK